MGLLTCVLTHISKWNHWCLQRETLDKQHLIILVFNTKILYFPLAGNGQELFLFNGSFCSHKMSWGKEEVRLPGGCKPKVFLCVDM